ncbi:MAG: GTPase Era [Treponema sp.]|nr:GTPase Era [Treponema sp.]
MITDTVKTELGDEQFKTAVVAIIGRPSAGKSTFLNTVCKEPVAIVSPVPQTTRDAIRGIVHTPFSQLIFVDTPGYHESDKKLNIRLRNVTHTQLKDADVILYIVDATRAAGTEESLTAELLAPYVDRVVVAVNKSDSPAAQVAAARSFIRAALPAVPDDCLCTMSALTNSGTDAVLDALLRKAPVAPALYPTDLYTDQDVEFRIAEIIRGEAINRLSEEIPHCLYVDIADAEFRNNGSRLWVRAFLCVERESQKGIVIGKGAAMIRAIRIAAIKKLRTIFDYTVDVDLQVKVDKNWRQKDRVLHQLIK